MTETSVPVSETGKILERIAGCNPLLNEICKLAGAYKGETTTQHSTEALEIKTEKLNKLILSMVETLEDPENVKLFKGMSAVENSHEVQYFRHIVKILEDFQSTLLGTELLLKSMKSSRLNRFRIRSTKEDELINRTGEVECYMETLQLIPQMFTICKITLAGGPYTPGVIVQMSFLYDNLLRALRSDKYTSWVVGNPNQRKEVLSRLKIVQKHFDEHATCACALISSATIRSSGPTFSVNESIFGDLSMKKQGAKKVNEWLPRPGPSSEENKYRSENDTGTQMEASVNLWGTNFSEVYPSIEKLQAQPHSTKSNESDIDDNFPATIYKTGCLYFEREEYALAETFLSKALKEYREGHSKSNVQKSVTESGDDDNHFDISKAKQLLAHTHVRQGKLDIGITILLGLIENITDTDPEAKPTLEYLELVHQLATIYKECGNLDNARSYAEEASRWRKKTLGKHHMDFHSSIELLAAICEAQGDIYKAAHYRSYIKEPIIGFWDEHLPIATPAIAETELYAVTSIPKGSPSNESIRTPSECLGSNSQPTEVELDADSHLKCTKEPEASSTGEVSIDIPEPIQTSAVDAHPINQTQLKKAVLPHDIPSKHTNSYDGFSSNKNLPQQPSGSVLGMEVFLTIHNEVLHLQHSGANGDNHYAQMKAHWYFTRLWEQSGRTDISYLEEKISIMCSHVRKGHSGLASIEGYSPLADTSQIPDPETLRLYYNVLHFYTQLSFTAAVSFVIDTLPERIIDLPDQSYSDPYHSSPLSFACERGHVPTIIALMNAGASVDSSSIQNLACSSSDMSAFIKPFLDRTPTDSFTRTWGDSLLSVLQHTNPHASNVLALLNELDKINLDERHNEWNGTILHKIRSTSSPNSSEKEIFQRLLEAGADPNADKGEYELKPLDLAYDARRISFMQILLDHGAKLSSWKYERLLKKCRRKRFSLRSKVDPQDPRIILLKNHPNGYPELPIPQ